MVIIDKKAEILGCLGGKGGAIAVTDDFNSHPVYFSLPQRLEMSCCKSNMYLCSERTL